MASPSVRLDVRARSVAGRVRRVSGWVRRWYGANPLHLLALLAAFALAGYAVHAVMAAGQWTGFAEWFAVAIIGHDLLLFPLYSLADLSLRHLLPGGSHGRLPEVKPATRGPFEPARPAVAPPRTAARAWRAGHRRAGRPRQPSPGQRRLRRRLSRPRWPRRGRRCSTTCGSR